MNNGMYQNGFGYPQPGVTPGMGGANGVRVASWLSPETINELKRNTEQFTLAVGQEDIKRAQCNHRNQDQTLALRPLEDGSCVCNVCGYRFRITEELTMEQVTAACDMLTDILQTSKLMYISLDPNVGREFFQILAFINKIPKLYEIACADFKKYDNVYGFTQQVPANAFSIFGSLSSPMPYYNPQQFTGQMPQQGQPMNQYAGGYPQQQFAQPGGNPFYYTPNGFQTQQMPMNQAYNNPAMGQPIMGGAMPFPGSQPMNQGYSLNAQGAASQPQNVATQQTSQPTATTPAKDEPAKVDAPFKA